MPLLFINLVSLYGIPNLNLSIMPKGILVFFFKLSGTDQVKEHGNRRHSMEVSLSRFSNLQFHPFFREPLGTINLPLNPTSTHLSVQLSVHRNIRLSIHPPIFSCSSRYTETSGHPYIHPSTCPWVVCYRQRCGVPETFSRK
jgi:hypothetical protein